MGSEQDARTTNGNLAAHSDRTPKFSGILEMITCPLEQLHAPFPLHQKGNPTSISTHRR